MFWFFISKNCFGLPKARFWIRLKKKSAFSEFLKSYDFWFVLVLVIFKCQLPYHGPWVTKEGSFALVEHNVITWQEGLKTPFKMSNGKIVLLQDDGENESIFIGFFADSIATLPRNLSRNFLQSFPTS